jgi:clan AA aspartic protease (TIGR02281 family)
MPQVFTVRWPLFARLEALLLFAVSLILAGEIAPVRTIINSRLIPALSPLGDRLSLPSSAIAWSALAIGVFAPYLFVLMVADRFLTVRKGYALLSLMAIAIWSGVAMHLSDQIAELAPDTILESFASVPVLTFDQQTALAGGTLALLAHCWPLWVGSRDRGDVAERLIEARHRRSHGNEPASDAHRQRDVYYRQTADFRGWQNQPRPRGLAGGPRESSAVKALYTLTWIGIVVGLGAAYVNRDNYTASKYGNARSAREAAARGVNAAVAPASQLPPVVQGPAARIATTTMPLPAVNRPTELPRDLPLSSGVSGPNEAVADRASDGSFAFDAVVNGGHVAMMFDTGATVVAVRAEDAARLGIDTTKLNYSAKVRTANGVTEVAPIVFDTLTIGNITQRAVIGCVAREGTLQMNLLGQSFLARLSGFNVEKNQLVLKGR